MDPGTIPIHVQLFIVVFYSRFYGTSGTVGNPEPKPKYENKNAMHRKGSTLNTRKKNYIPSNINMM